jgi:hypothetical protein
MPHHLRVVLQDGTVYRASAVEHVPGFVRVVYWDGEVRVPAGEVVEVYSSRTERLSWLMLILAIAFFCFVVMAWL